MQEITQNWGTARHRRGTLSRKCHMVKFRSERRGFLPSAFVGEMPYRRHLRSALLRRSLLVQVVRLLDASFISFIQCFLADLYWTDRLIMTCMGTYSKRSIWTYGNIQLTSKNTSLLRIIFAFQPFQVDDRLGRACSK